MKDFIRNSDMNDLTAEPTSYVGQFEHLVYLAATHEFGTVDYGVIKHCRHLNSAAILHKVQVKAAVIVRRNIREGHDWHNSKGHCRRWMGKYDRYMSARKYKSYVAYQNLVEEIITNTGSYNGR